VTIDQARDAVKVRLGQVAKGINPRTELIFVRSDETFNHVEKIVRSVNFLALVKKCSKCFA
jgi:hypothetical protein